MTSQAAHLASRNYRQLTDEELSGAGVRPEMIRPCIGIKHIENVITDPGQALPAAV